VAEAIAAYRYAEALQRPLNLSLDLHWAYTGFSDEAVFSRRAVVAALLASQRHWLKSRGAGFYSILVRENPPASEQGEHAHQLLNVQADLREGIEAHTRKFLSRGKRHRARALEAKTVYNDGKLAYILKGATLPARELLAAMFKTDYERSSFLASTSSKTRQGRIPGKRVSISEALGPAARRQRALLQLVTAMPSPADEKIKQVDFGVRIPVAAWRVLAQSGHRLNDRFWPKADTGR